MSAAAYLLIRCDHDHTGDGCDAEASWPVRFEPHTHRELRRLLKERDGWRFTRDGRDLCPEHA
jgi:hypothetical protein